jgi:23S rRNA (cytidine1920-2'-O)/16S rRNA (cytidine1409-2'-O)-methyltransferase
MAKNKERLDKILADKGLFETKSKAQGAIMAGDVRVNNEVITKAGYLLEWKESTVIEVKSLPFVSRGGLKLDKAVKTFRIDLKDRVCLDAGASTGGFTDCMLQNGAKKVYAVDVGYGQIAWKLRNDARVKVIERTNIRNCAKDEIYNENEELPDFCAMDLSFISITKVLENVKKLMADGNIEIVSLIKPQFEAGKEFVGKNGVVREKPTHIKVIEDILAYAASTGFFPQQLTFSPIQGPAGNIEYLVLFSDEEGEFDSQSVCDIVEEAFDCFIHTSLRGRPQV